MIEIQLSFTNS